MFGFGALKRRLERLEERLDKLEQEENCKKGRHVFEVCIHSADDIPHARCKHCFFHPKTESK